MFTVLYQIAGLLLLGFLVYLIEAEKDGQTIVLLAAGICMIAPRIKDLTKLDFGVGGFKTEMQEALRKNEAKLEQLQALGIKWAETTVELSASAGRWGGYSRRGFKELTEDMVATLEQLGVTDTRFIGEIAHRWDHFDYASQVLRNLSTEYSPEWNTALNEFMDSHGGVGAEPSPDELEAFLLKFDKLDDGVREWLEDYRHFDQTRHHRRPEVWFTT